MAGTSAQTLFLDVDGVLLSGRAWLLPSNRYLRDTLANSSRPTATRDIIAQAVLDPVAVELVNCVAQATGASIVVSSTWRYSPGLEITRRVLLDQGIRADLMSSDWSCAVVAHQTIDKRRDIVDWLQAHPEVTDYLVLDDEPDLVPGHTLVIDPLDGLGPREAAAAVRYLRGHDSTLGVGHLSVDDEAMVVDRFRGDRIKAACWLEGVEKRVPRRLRPSMALNGPQRVNALANLLWVTQDTNMEDGAQR